MTSEIEQEDRNLIGFGATLGLAAEPMSGSTDRGSLRSRLIAAMGEGRSPDRTAPPPQRILAGISAWGFVLALGGIVVGLAALVRIIAGTPGWFEPVIVLVGLIGVGLTVAGFATVQIKRTPWMLLGLATATLVIGAAITAAA